MKSLFPSTFLVLFLVLFVNAFDALSQENSKKSSMLEKISLTPQVGLLHSWSDFREEGLMPGFLQLDQNKLGLNFSLNYNISKVFRVSAGLLTGELEGEQTSINTTGAANEPRDLGKGIYFNTAILEVTFPRIDVNLTRLIFQDKVKLFNKFSVNLFASHGLVWFDSKIYSIQDDINLLYGKRRGRTGKTTEAVSSYGLGLTYRLSDRFDLGLETSIHNVWSDKLDAWVTPGSANDKYSYTAVGISYYLKKRKQKLEEFIEEQPSILAEEGVDIIEDSGPQTIVEKSADLNDTLSIIDLPSADKETVFGVYTYQKLPSINQAIVVLDENGIPIDTIYTDADGKFSYTKLSTDPEVSFAPLNATDINLEEVELALSSSSNTEVKNLVFSESEGRFIVFQKLAMQPDSTVVDPSLDFKAIDLDDKTLFGRYEYNKLPMADNALVVMDQNGVHLDTIYTDESGNFLYSRLDLDNSISIVPLNMSDIDLKNVDIFLTDKKGQNAKQMILDKANSVFVMKKLNTSIADATPKTAGKTQVKEGLSIYEGGGNFVVVAAFRGLQGSKRKVDELMQKGIKPIVTRNKRDTWYLICLNRYDDKETALQKMREARSNGFEKAWVGIK